MAMLCADGHDLNCTFLNNRDGLRSHIARTMFELGLVPYGPFLRRNSESGGNCLMLRGLVWNVLSRDNPDWVAESPWHRYIGNDIPVACPRLRVFYAIASLKAYRVRGSLSFPQENNASTIQELILIASPLLPAARRPH
jgi:hypothetical protein